MTLCSAQSCTGCSACYNACLKGAINMVPDNEGFLHPMINTDLCIECGICSKACPVLQKEQTKQLPTSVYACWLKNKRIRKSSTSGGAFSAFSNTILKDNGIVIGAAYDDNLNVCHKMIRCKEELFLLKGSKYVQSKIGDTYNTVLSELKKGTKVLFTGTPCQVDGLYGFLGKRYEGQLFTADLVCHGVPSPKVYDAYKNYMSELYSSEISEICIRKKTPGWLVWSMGIHFSNGKKYLKDLYNDYYLLGFLSNYFLRPSCHNCQYANTSRVADITMADFWGYFESSKKDRDNDKGISLILVNNENGNALFESSKDYLYYFTRTLEDAKLGNPCLSHCFSAPENRSEFWKDFDLMPFDLLAEKYFPPKETTISYNRKKRIKRDLQYLKYDIIHLPNRIMCFLIGKKRYEKLKKILKGSH